jgi:hypothetical protein
MLLFCNDDTWEKVSPDELKAMYGEIGAWWEKHSKAGTIFGGAQLQPARTATTVRHENGGTLVTDGPFIEAKETVGGFALVEVADLDGALQLAKTWPAKGSVEVRPLVPDNMSGM